MAEPRRPSDEELGEDLARLGRAIDYPKPRDAWPVVRARIVGHRRRPWWAVLAGPRLPLVPVALAVLAIVVGVFALSPDARSAAQEFLRLRGVEIFRAPQTPSPTPTRTAGASPAPLAPGERLTLAEARAAVSFAFLVPTDAALGDPDEVFVARTASTAQVYLIYRVRSGIPPSPQAGVSALVAALRGGVEEAIFGKVVGPGTKLEPVTVNGGRGFWLEGSPHQFFYRDPSGGIRDETLRLAGNTLLWEHGGVTYRLEANVSKGEAVRIAASFR